jgi:hypothetical protein
MEQGEVKEKKREFTLPNKTLILRPLLDKTPGMVKDPMHVAAFLLQGTDRIICAPRIKGRKEIDCPLTEEERTFFEDKDRSGMTFEKGDLSVYSKKWGRKGGKNWWEDSQHSIIKLGKSEMRFDLSNPMDYIRYKILLKNSDIIARHRDDLHLKPSYLYVFEEESDVARKKATSTQKKMDAFIILSKMNKDQSRMIDLCSVLGIRVTSNQEISFLVAALGEVIENNVDKFLSATEDEYFDEKVLIKKLLTNRLIERRNSSYFLKNGDPMCNAGESPFLENACFFLKSSENQDIRMNLEAKLIGEKPKKKQE